MTKLKQPAKEEIQEATPDEALTLTAEAPSSSAPQAEPAQNGAASNVDPAKTHGPLVPTDPKTRQLLKGLREAAAKGISPINQHDEKRLRREAERQAKRDQQLKKGVAKHSAFMTRVAAQLGLDTNRAVTDIPPLLSDEHQQVDFVTVQADRSFIRISFDPRANRHLYEVIEPKLTATESDVLKLVRDTLVRTMEARPPKGEDAEQYLLRSIDEAIVDHSVLVDEVSKQKVQYYILRDFVGYGPIDVLMKDPMIEDISCDGPTVPIFLFHRQYEALETNIVFEEESKLDSFVVRLAQRCGKQISIAEPLLDATLPDKSRLQVALSREVTTRGSTFTIRKFRSDPLTPTDLVRYGTFSPEMAAYFWILIENGMSLIYAGGTASGKTSSINAVATFIPAQKKIVSIEDTREINISHKNWIAGLTRTGFGGEVVGGKVAGTIDQYKLLEAALRQRPEYLLVGEVRGAEALTLFQAMATGHATYSTMHADSAPSAVYRLENPPINVPRIMLTSLNCIAIQVQTRVKERMVRRCKEIVEITGIDPETKDILTNMVFQWDPGTDTFKRLGKSRLFQWIMERKALTYNQMEAELKNRADVIRWMVEKGIRRIDDVSNIVSNYYNRSDALLDLIHGKVDALPSEMDLASGHGQEKKEVAAPA